MPYPLFNYTPESTIHTMGAKFMVGDYVYDCEVDEYGQPDDCCWSGRGKEYEDYPQMSVPPGFSAPSCK